MKKQLFRGAAISGAAALGCLAYSPMLLAQTNSQQQFKASLSQLNGSGVSGTLTAKLDGNKLTVDEQLNGLLKNAPHAQHLHFSADATHTCPTNSVIKNNKPGGANDKPFPYGNDNVLESVEAQPSYGAVNISLTTKGDTGAGSALALDRFPKTSGNILNYQRTITLTDNQVKILKQGQFVVVSHGLELFGKDNRYTNPSNDTEKSALAKVAGAGDNVSLEATAPNSCGVLTAVSGGQGGGAVQGAQTTAPSGAPATGGGSTAGFEDAAWLAAGSAAILTGGSLAYAVYRQRQATISKNSPEAKVSDEQRQQ